MNKSDFFQYGENVDGYDVLVLNEREARAGAGILFAIGILSLTNAVMLHHIIVTKYFITFFVLDFLIRVIQPGYSPSLLLGRLFIRNQIPEYVGAAQKRFAWAIGLFLAIPMFYMIAINFQPNPIKVLICVICLILLISESAFSFCFGCMIFNFFKKEKVTNCPGGTCETQVKDRAQKFNTVQKIIVSLSLILALYGGYSYTYKLDNKTKLGKHLGKIMMSDTDKKALKEKQYEQALKNFDNDNDF